MNKPQSASPIFPLCQNGMFKDTISSMAGSTIQSGLLVTATSWDKTAKCFFVSSPNQIQPISETVQQCPIIKIISTPQPTVFVFGCVDGSVYIWNVESKQTQKIAQHDGCVTSLKFINEMNAVMSAGLDGVLQLTSANNLQTQKLPTNNKIYAMDQVGDYLCYSNLNRVEVYNLRANKLETNSSISTSNVATSNNIQCLKMFPSGNGLIYGATDGRANVITFKSSYSQQTYAFKAQHKKINNSQAYHYPVNSLSFFNDSVFLTSGSDGVINIWNRQKKSLVNTIESPQNLPITCADFICDGKLLAFSIGYDWHMGISSSVHDVGSLPILKVVDEALVKS
ncbi:WD domain containing protein [Entamoeba marina]